MDIVPTDGTGAAQSEEREFRYFLVSTAALGRATAYPCLFMCGSEPQNTIVGRKVKFAAGLFLVDGGNGAGVKRTTDGCLQCPLMQGEVIPLVHHRLRVSYFAQIQKGARLKATTRAPAVWLIRALVPLRRH